MRVYMIATCASPEAVLHEGRVYEVSRAMAKKLLAGGRVAMQGSDGRPVWGGAAEPFDPKKHGNLKVNKVPAKPDPGDTGEDEIEDFDAEDAEDEDEDAEDTE